MGKILGIDYGSRRVGLAISDHDKTIAFPFRTLEYHSSKELKRKLISLVSEEDVEKIVVGLPLGMKGQRTSQTKTVENFVEEISKCVSIPVDVIDERLSSIEATRSLLKQGYHPSRKKYLVDTTAAAIFLQSYLDKLGFR